MRTDGTTLRGVLAVCVLDNEQVLNEDWARAFRVIFQVSIFDGSVLRREPSWCVIVCSWLAFKARSTCLDKSAALYEIECELSRNGDCGFCVVSRRHVRRPYSSGVVGRRNIRFTRSPLSLNVISMMTTTTPPCGTLISPRKAVRP
jgi:hypothetical protein